MIINDFTNNIVKIYIVKRRKIMYFNDDDKKK